MFKHDLNSHLLSTSAPPTQQLRIM